MSTRSLIATTRRSFVVQSAGLAAGGFALGLLPATARGQVINQPFMSNTPAGPEVNAWVVVKPDDTVIIRIVRTEMGQGTRTGLAQLVAEELQCDWAKVTTEDPTPGQSLARKRAWGEFSTGGSRGIRISQDYVRKGGAAARMMLMQAAANSWNVPVSELKVDKGVVTHASGKRATYGQLAADASKLTPPDQASIRLKGPKDWTVAGKPLRRIDTLDKLNGQKVFAADLRMPGMLIAAIKDSPVFGGKMVSFDESKVMSMRGVKKVVRVNASAVAVVADNWWRAKQALEALPVVWDDGPNAKASSATIAAHLKEGLSAQGDLVGRAEGNIAEGLGKSVKRIEATYSSPFLAHAPMEPMNCTVRCFPDRAEAWVPTQNGEASHAALAEATGYKLEQCEIFKMDPGGAFGRRGGTQDYVHQAVAIAKQFPGVPVKLLWSREEDQAHDFYRPISQCKLEGGLDDKGNLNALRIRIAGQSINAWLNPQAIRGNVDQRQIQGLWKTLEGDAQMGYTIPNLSVEYAMRNTHVPVGPWRGVNTNQNGVYLECFIEELARAAGKDSVEFRRALMQNHPKHLAVLEAAAKHGDWGKPLPAGVHRGIAQFMGYGSYSAATAEVSVKGKEIRVHRMVLALDCGHVVNPEQVAAQVEGSVAYGLSATFYGENSVENGRIKELNFDTYQLLKLAGMPKVETIMVPTHDFWGGVGEPTICVVAPAVLNALYAALGKPLRDLPLKNAGYTFVG